MVSSTQTPKEPTFLSILGPKNEGLFAISMADQTLVSSWIAGKATKTQVAYLKVATDLFEFAKGKPLSKIGESDLKSFLKLKKWQALDTKKQRAAILKALFKFARRKKYIQTDPAEDLESVKSHDKINERYLSEEEVFRIIDRTPDIRNKTLLKVLYLSGLRISEVIKLDWEHIIERKEGVGQITVIGKRSKQRSILIPKSVFSELRKLKPVNARSYDPVFISREGSRLSSRMVQLIVEKARLLAGIERKVSPHWFRHAHASHALDRGCPIHLLKESLGHSDISTTGRYLKARPNESSSKYLGV